ncbi:MAG: hypothetical protein OTI36_07495 [Beijerinckiaceae bacterium]|nr:hypothetical protein [Beijerinckiaceae bacterium]
MLLLFALIILFQDPREKIVGQKINYTDFLTMQPHVRDVTIRGDEATGHDDQNRAFSVTLPHDPAIATRLAQSGVAVVIAPAAAADGQSWEKTLLVNALPLVAYLYLVTLPLFRVAKSIDALGERLDRKSVPLQE